MLPRSRFVHTRHILKAFLQTANWITSAVLADFGETLIATSRKMFLMPHPSIEWLIPNLIFRAILGNADNPALKVG